MQQHEPTYEVKIFLHMNLSYELIKHVQRNSCLWHFDPRYLKIPLRTAEDIYPKNK